MLLTAIAVLTYGIIFIRYKPEKLYYLSQQGIYTTILNIFWSEVFVISTSRGMTVSKMESIGTKFSILDVCGNRRSASGKLTRKF